MQTLKLLSSLNTKKLIFGFQKPKQTAYRTYFTYSLFQQVLYHFSKILHKLTS